MAGDWRLTVTLPQHADAEGFELWLTENLREGDVTRDGSTLHLYADDPRGVKHVERVLAMLCDELETPAHVIVERWNPGSEEWQTPGLPVGVPEAPLAEPDDLDFDALTHEVIASSPARVSRDLLERLRRELDVFPLGPRRIWGAASSVEAAQELVDRLRLELPTGTQIRLEPLTSRRRWLRRQQLVGDYSSGGK